MCGKYFSHSKNIFGDENFFKVKKIEKSNFLKILIFEKSKFRFFQKSKNTKFFKKNDLIFWTGHVAVCINNKSLIHAYGPKKKVVIMNIKKTINEIKQNAKLSVIGKMK